jgi:hypothetical protein
VVSALRGRAAVISVVRWRRASTVVQGPVPRAWRHAMAASVPCALAAVVLVGVEEGESEARRGRVVVAARGSG